jgi:hypothetical protein
MKGTVLPLVLSLATCVTLAACASDTPVSPSGAGPSRTTGLPINLGSREPYTVAVIGDTPYGAAKLAELPDLIAQMNADPKVDLVVHLGDIKAGSNSPCTDEYFQLVHDIYADVKDPFVYTPGDNEWTDCHQAGKNNGFYTPTERLQAIRALFFPVPGQTMGGRKKRVLTQADDPANSAYVENTMWMESRVVFATLNITGSNDDLASWGSPLPANASSYPSQSQERASRSQANSAWLAKAFATAADNDADGVVLAFQADMWDVTSSLSGFDAIVVQIGNLAAAFGKPVLLLEGDSHVFNVDHPYTASSALFGVHPGTPVATNVTRIVVEGSAAGRTEYLRLTFHPQGPTTGTSAGLFTYERVPRP